MRIDDGIRAGLEFGLADALLTRRSRRFGLGMSIAEGPLAHESAYDPVPLSETEEALLVWLGTGTTGLALGDLPRDGVSWMHGWGGRAWPCSCNARSTELFYTNDEGIHLVRLRDRTPEDGATALFFEGEDRSALADRIARLFRETRHTLEPERADLPTGEPGLFSFNSWNVNRPGTSLFVPVTNTTIEYMTLLFIYFDEVNRFAIVDELAGDMCGLERWVGSGRLGRVSMPLFDLEQRVLTTLNVEGAFICQNMSLAMQALGLGGWAFTGFLPHHVLGIDPEHRGLGFEFVTPESTPRAVATPAPVGRRGVLEALCPPYVPDMEEAVRRFLADRAAAAENPLPYERPREVVGERGEHSEETVEIVTTFCQTVLDRYGRFPASIDPMFVRLICQAHHLDTDYYDEHYPGGAYTRAHRDHFALWHPEHPGGPPRRDGR